ncbi:MAG: adenosine kinase [Alphaproteobacteria bacterium]|nr:adenosine kinase [Alphaproteobacteria bacterium]
MANSKTHHVIAYGSAIVDVLAEVEDAFLLTHNIAKGVMTLIDEHRAAQLYGAFGRPKEVAGGSAANTMAGLASLGARGCFVGKTKADRLGEAFFASMKDTGVDYATPASGDGPQTACCLIAVTPDGERSMNTYLGAARELGTGDVTEAAIAAAQVLYIEGYLWDAPKAKAASLKAIDIARASGTKVAFTLSDPFLMGRYRDEFLALLPKLDILFANEEEAKALFAADDFDSVLQAVRPLNAIAALTRSEKGCVAAKGGEVHVVDAVPVARVVDTTGAGDQFAAGFLYGLTHGFDLARCGRLGSLAAAEVISHVGARPVTPLKQLAASAGLL